MWTAALLLSSFLWQAPRLDCPESETKTIRVDGILNEWNALAILNLNKNDIVSGADKRNNDKDLAVALRSTYAAGEGVFFLIEVTDSRIIVSNKNPDNNDHVVFSVGDPKKKIKFIPPYESRKAVITGLPSGAQARVVKQELGYAIELGLPWGTWDLQPDLIQVPISITVYDADSSVAGKPETVMALDKADFPRHTLFEFAAIRNLQQEVFDKLGVSDVDVKFSNIGNYAAGKKVERALWVGRHLVLLGGDVGITFFFMQLTDDENNIVKCQPMDMDGDGVLDFFTELKIVDGDNQWKMISVWTHQPRGIARIFAHMLEFTMKEHHVINTYKIVEKGKKRNIDMNFVKASSSITQKNWKGNPPDPEIIPFIMPWDKPDKRSYSFSYGKYIRSK